MVFGLFKKKKKKNEIKINEVDAWLKKTLESKNLGMKISILKREISSKKIKIKELLQELKDAELKDESVVPERAKSIFKGNKSAYIQKTHLFLENLNPPEELSNLEEFLEETSEKLERLAEETNKNYFIIKEFSEDEVRSVGNKIKELDKLISTARSSLEKTPLHKFKEIKKTLNEYYECMDKVDEIKTKMEKTLEKKGEELNKRKRIEEKINKLKESPQSADYKRLKENKKELEEKIKQKEYQIINLFSGISSVLKKYSKKKRNSIAKKYSENAVDALLGDGSLKIHGVLKDLLKVKDALDVKDSKLKKLEKDVETISGKNLEKMRLDLDGMNQELKDFNNRLKNHSYLLNLKEQEGIISIIDENLKEIEKKEQENEDLLERNNPRLIKQKLKSLIKEVDEYTDLI